MEQPILDSLLMNLAGLLANIACRNDNNRAKIMQVLSLLASLVQKYSY